MASTTGFLKTKDSLETLCWFARKANQYPIQYFAKILSSCYPTPENEYPGIGKIISGDGYYLNIKGYKIYGGIVTICDFPNEKPYHTQYANTELRIRIFSEKLKKFIDGSIYTGNLENIEKEVIKLVNRTKQNEISQYYESELKFWRDRNLEDIIEELEVDYE